MTFELSRVANVRRNILSISKDDGDDTTCASVYLLWASHDKPSLQDPFMHL